MSADAKDLYLDLLKKTLSFTLWQEPGIPVEVSVRKTLDFFLRDYVETTEGAGRQDRHRDTPAAPRE